MITVNAESFEHVFSLVQKVEKRNSSQIHHLSTNNKELMESIDERYGLYTFRNTGNITGGISVKN